MKCILGTMEMGRRLTTENSHVVLKSFLQKYKELDTAEMYSDTQSESILGQNIEEIRNFGGEISTKINPTNNGFDPEVFENRFKKCLGRLKLNCVDVLYLHWPCKEKQIEPLIDKINEMHKKNYFKRLGISNYPSWMVAKIAEYCMKNGYVTPSVYQGMYNCLTRDVERELLPCLREYKISFYAYNPLAGGILTGRYKYEDRENFDSKTQCRFHGISGNFCQIYQDRFWHKPYFDALEKIKPILGPITPLQASYNWLINHSMLSSQYGDGITIGASTLEQFNQNMKAMDESSRLSDEVVNTLNECYNTIKGCQPSYFR